MAFNRKYPYMRFHDWMTRDNVGTDTLQTSGTFSGPPIPWRNHGLTGNAILTQDYTLHSYQCVPLGDPPWFGQFNIEVSNDGENYTCIYSQDMDTGLAGPLADPRSVAYSDTWTFSYSRPIVTGTHGSYLINERHLA